MAATVKMRIESAFMITGRGPCVFARRLEQKDFRVSTTSRLAGVPVKPVLDIPRITKEDGTLDLEVFAFLLEQPADLSRFQAEIEVLFEEAV